VKRQLGSVPNLYRVIGTSPAALQATLELDRGLARSSFDGKARERIALTVAELNGCDYCLSAHTYLGKHVFGLDDGELDANRDGGSADPRVAAALRFAAEVVRERGHVSDAALAAVRAAGYDDAQVIELVLIVVLNTLTNYVNSVAGTAIDFPVVTARAA
jgi:AhpD family alkylhydroperoxidase